MRELSPPPPPKAVLLPRVPKIPELQPQHEPPKAPSPLDDDTAHGLGSSFLGLTAIFPDLVQALIFLFGPLGT